MRKKKQNISRRYIESRTQNISLKKLLSFLFYSLFLNYREGAAIMKIVPRILRIALFTNKASKAAANFFPYRENSHKRSTNCKAYFLQFIEREKKLLNPELLRFRDNSDIVYAGLHIEM